MRKILDIFKSEHTLRQEQLSQLVADIDVAWMSDGTMPGKPKHVTQFIAHAAIDGPENAALVVRERMDRLGGAANIALRLGKLGIRYGELRPNDMFPGGVWGGWRSDTPMVLATKDVPVHTDRAYELAKAVGRVLYFGDDATVELFAGELASQFVVVEGNTFEPLEQGQPRTHRQLGS